MKRFYLLKIFLIACILGTYGGGSAVAQTTVWSEDWSSTSSGDIPTSIENSSAKYTYTDGGSKTKIYNEALAGGTPLELLVSKSGGSLTATIDNLQGCANFTLSFKSNKTLAVTANGTALTLTSSEKTYTGKFTIDSGTTSLVIVFSNRNSSNARLDDIVLTGEVVGDKTTPTLSLSETACTATLGSDFTEPTFTSDSDGGVSYTSSNKEVATVDASTGEVTPLTVGKTTITIETASTDNYTSASITYELTVLLSGISGSGTEADPYNVAAALNKIVSLTSTSATTETYYVKGKVVDDVTGDAQYNNASFYISEDGTTTNQLSLYRCKYLDNTDFSDQITLKAGTEIVVVGKLQYYNSKTPQVTSCYITSITAIEGEKLDPALYFDNTSISTLLGFDFAEPIVANPYDLTVTYESSEESIATVDASTGEVTPLAVGTTEITAKTAGTETYKEGSATYTLTVVDPSVYDIYTLVTSTEQLVIGARYVLANAEAGKVATANSGNNYKVVEAVFGGNKVALTNAATEKFILGGEAGAYTLYGSQGYVGSASSSSNNMKPSSTAKANNKASIDIDANGNATIIFGGEYTRNVMKFNNTLFSCYGSSTTVTGTVQLYRSDIGTLNIPSVEGYGTFFTDKAFVMPEGVQGSLVTNAAEGKLTLGWEYQEGATVPANTALLLKGAQGDYTYAVTSTTEVAPAENMLKGSMDNSLTEGNAGDKFYKLSYNKDEKIGFFWGGDNGAAFENKAGKAYLVISQALASKVSGFILDDNEVTGITSVGVQQNDGAIYNMQGIRVQNANRKGIYIINGKKVIK